MNILKKICLFLFIFYISSSKFLCSMGTESSLESRIESLSLRDSEEEVLKLFCEFPTLDSFQKLTLNIPVDFYGQDCLLLFTGINYENCEYDSEDILNVRRFGISGGAFFSSALNDLIPPFFRDFALDEDILIGINENILSNVDSLLDSLKRKLKKFYVNFFDSFHEKTIDKNKELSKEYAKLKDFFDKFDYRGVPFISTSTKLERALKYAFGIVMNGDRTISTRVRAENKYSDLYYGKVLLFLIPISEIINLDLDCLRILYAKPPENDFSGTAFNHRYLISDYEVLFSSLISKRYIIGQIDAKVPFNYEGEISDCINNDYYEKISKYIESELADKKIKRVYHQIDGSFGSSEPTNKEIKRSRDIEKRR
jgi:hypothetical protein